jgi:hypothetical protein
MRGGGGARSDAKSGGLEKQNGEDSTVNAGRGAGILEGARPAVGLRQATKGAHTGQNRGAVLGTISAIETFDKL